MTKRIFAAVLALVLSLSVFAIPTFAAGSVSVGANGNKITATWAPVANAAKYEVRVFGTSGQVGSGSYAHDSTKESYTHTYTATAAGTYEVQVTALDGVGKTVDTFSGSISVSYTQTAGKLTFVRNADKTVTVSWAADSKATAGYYVSYTVSGKSAVETTTDSTSITISGVEATSTVNVSVWYNTEATLKAGSIGSGTLSASGASSGTGTGTGTSTGNVTVIPGTRTITWTNLGSGVSYQIYINGTLYTTTTATSYTVPVGVTHVEVKWAIGGTAVQSLGTATLSATGTGSTSNGGVYVTPGTRTIYWNPVGSGVRYSIYVNGMSTAYTTTTATSMTVQSGITSVTVKYTMNGSTYTVGTVSLPYTGNASGSSSSNNNTNHFTQNGLTINKGTTYSVVSWNAQSNVIAYFVEYTNLSTNKTEKVATNETSCQVPFSYLDKWQVTVTAWTSAAQTTVGSVVVYPTGTSVGSTTGTTTTQGTNCTVVSNASSSVITWSGNAYTSYNVMYTVSGGSTQMTTVTGTSTTIPYGNTYDVDIYVFTGNTVVAYASVKKATNSSSTNVGNATTTITNLTLTTKNSWTTTISWDKVTNASYYIITYGLYGTSGAGEETYALTNSADIPFGPGVNYVVYVTAVLNNGTTKAVGSATHIAGTQGSTSTDDTTIADYVTNLKGVSGETGKIKLSWNAADDADKYTIYYKRTANSEWLKAGTVTKCAVNIKGLKDGVSYDFKVVANGNDSGVVTITPSTSTKTVVADDPETVDTTTTIPVISSATSSKSGNATIKWSKVEDATSYKVYFAASGSNTYKSKATVSTNSCTITGLDSGTYKVRVKALVDGEWTALADCDYVTVTVK